VRHQAAITKVYKKMDMLPKDVSVNV